MIGAGREDEEEKEKWGKREREEKERGDTREVEIDGPLQTGVRSIMTAGWTIFAGKLGRTINKSIERRQARQEACVKGL